jgi:hypothetical protein
MLAFVIYAQLTLIGLDGEKLGCGCACLFYGYASDAFSAYLGIRLDSESLLQSFTSS